MASRDARTREIRRPVASRAALQDAPLPKRGITTTDGRYMIHLFPDHTVQKHFETIGRTYDLERLFHDDIKIYSAHLNEQLLDSIRRDPGVQGVVRPSQPVDEEPDWVKVGAVFLSEEESQSVQCNDRNPSSGKAALEGTLVGFPDSETATGNYFIRFCPEHGPDEHFDAIGRSHEYGLDYIYDDGSTICYAAKGLSKEFLELVWSDPGVKSVIPDLDDWEEGDQDDEDEWALSRIDHNAVAVARLKVAERHQQNPGGAAAAYHAPLEDPSDPGRGAHIVPARYLVFLRSGHSPEMHFSAIGYRYRLSRVYQYKGTFIYFAAMEVDLLELVRSDPGVEAVVFNTAGKEDMSATSKAEITAHLGGSAMADTEIGSTKDHEPGTGPARYLASLADPSQPEKGVGIVPERYMFNFFQGYNPIDHFRALGRTYEIRTIADCSEYNIWGATMSDELRDRMRSDPRVESIDHVACGVWEGKRKTNVSNPPYMAPLADPSQPEEDVTIVPGRYMFSFVKGHTPVDHFRALGRTYNLQLLFDHDCQIFGATMSDELRDRMRTDAGVESVDHVCYGVDEDDEEDEEELGDEGDVGEGGGQACPPQKRVPPTPRKARTRTTTSTAPMVPAYWAALRGPKPA